MALYVVLKIFRQIWSAYFFNFAAESGIISPNDQPIKLENENELEQEINNYKIEKN